MVGKRLLVLRIISQVAFETKEVVCQVFRGDSKYRELWQSTLILSFFICLQPSIILIEKHMTSNEVSWLGKCSQREQANNKDY